MKSSTLVKIASKIVVTSIVRILLGVIHTIAAPEIGSILRPFRHSNILDIGENIMPDLTRLTSLTRIRSITKLLKEMTLMMKKNLFMNLPCFASLLVMKIRWNLRHWWKYQARFDKIVMTLIVRILLGIIHTIAWNWINSEAVSPFRNLDPLWPQRRQCRRCQYQLWTWVWTSPGTHVKITDIC